MKLLLLLLFPVLLCAAEDGAAEQTCEETGQCQQCEASDMVRVLCAGHMRLCCVLVYGVLTLGAA